MTPLHSTQIALHTSIPHNATQQRTLHTHQQHYHCNTHTTTHTCIEPCLCSATISCARVCRRVIRRARASLFPLRSSTIHSCVAPSSTATASIHRRRSLRDACSISLARSPALSDTERTDCHVHSDRTATNESRSSHTHTASHSHSWLVHCRCMHTRPSCNYLRSPIHRPLLVCQCHRRHTHIR